jgi:hypothetical protein
VVAFRIASLEQTALRRDVRSMEQLILLTVVSFGLAGLLLVGLELGLGQRLVGHLYWDASAQVRLSQWGVIGQLTCTELLFGIRRESLIALLTPLWLTNGVEVIENFWLLMFVSLGAFGFVIFLTAICSLLLFYWQRIELRGKILLIATVIAASTSNSLGRKSCLLVVLVAAMSSFMDSAVTVEQPLKHSNTGQDRRCL